MLAPSSMNPRIDGIPDLLELSNPGEPKSPQPVVQVRRDLGVPELSQNLRYLVRTGALLRVAKLVDESDYKKMEGDRSVPAISGLASDKTIKKRDHVVEATVLRDPLFQGIVRDHIIVRIARIAGLPQIIREEVIGGL